MEIAAQVAAETSVPANHTRFARIRLAAAWQASASLDARVEQPSNVGKKRTLRVAGERPGSGPLPMFPSEQPR